jgi:hypothetical protein
MSIFKEFKEDSPPLVLFNTGCLFDMMTGSFSIGHDGKFYFNGGLGTFITGVHGKGNTHKSTLTDSLLMGLMRIYTDIDCFCNDTEHSKDKTRTISFMISPLFANTDLSERYTLYSGAEWTIGTLYAFLRDICKVKADNKKEMTVQTPFMDYKGKRISTWKPTVVHIDSFSQLKSDAEAETLLSKDFEDKKNKTLWMDDGNKKTMFMSALNKMCAEYGIIVVVTAHTGVNFSMDPMSPPKKELLFQKQDDKIKNVGSKFTTLTHILAQIASCRVCVDSNKEALYKQGDTAANDLNELSVIISRNKVSQSGISVPFVVSQQYGLLNDVSNLHFLKQYDYVGLIGGASKPNNACTWLPDITFSRNNFREKASVDYKLCRALELVAQYRYIQLSWNLSKLPIDFSQTPEAIFDKLTKSSVKMNDILETTSHWNYNKQDRNYLCLFDILSDVAKK